MQRNGAEVRVWRNRGNSALDGARPFRHIPPQFQGASRPVNGRVDMSFLKQLFTWWNGQTLNTRFYTWRKGEYVGADEFGNKYYRAKSALPESIKERRWVIYNGYSEASTIPPGWHGWMHHRDRRAAEPGRLSSRASGRSRTFRIRPARPTPIGPRARSSSGSTPAPRAADYSAWRPE